MRSTLDELSKDLAELRALVSSIGPVNAALAGLQDTIVSQYVQVRRRFDNAAFLVVLYSAFEKFIENLATAYIRLESRRVKYAALPESLTKKHLTGTAELLQRSRIGEGRYAGLSHLSVVKNLFECLSGIDPYSLNEVAVVGHDANLRAIELDSVFGAIGIEQVCDRARKADAMLEWYCRAAGLDSPPREGVERTVIEERLKEIVERRNDVAHRGGNPDDLLGETKMNEAIGFIEAFSKAVFSIAVSRYLQDHHAKTAIRLKQRDGDGPYKNGFVVVVEKPERRLFVGQPLYVIVNSDGARWGRIQSICVDNADVQAVDADTAATNGIGIRADFKCPRGARLVALEREDDVVWSPGLTGS